MHKSLRFVHFFYVFMQLYEYLFYRKNARKSNGSKLLQKGSKFADDFFSLSGKISAPRKNCPKRSQTARFCPNGSKMVVQKSREKIKMGQGKIHIFVKASVTSVETILNCYRKDMLYIQRSFQFRAIYQSLSPYCL